jgi:signal transduction histidine kinase
VQLSPERPADEAGWRPDPEVEARVRSHLTALGPRPLDVRVFGDWRRDWRNDRRRHKWHDHDHDNGPVEVTDLLPSRQKLAINVAQADGSWLAFIVSAETTSLRWALHMAFWILLTGGFILLFAIWAARRVAKPLTRFAEAADRLGVDVNAPPLPETGAAELRKASRAFNRMQDRLRRFVEDRTLMLAAISHDLRTGLTRLKLRSEFIADPEQQSKALADLDEMEAMLDATLAFARDDAAKERRRRFDLSALLQSLADEQTDQGAGASYEGPEHLHFEGRPTALKRALANLVSNAVKYGGVAEIALREVDEGLRITVSDRGPGIPEAARERVFAPFHRLETSRSRETGGTGLGLAVARSIVRRHGGDIALADRPGGGLVATVSLPRVGL